jgi:transposase
MRKPIYIRPLTEDEQHTLHEGLRSSNAFLLRRCQILLASARGQTARVIGAALGGNDQTVRNVLHAFNAQGLVALTRQSSAPQRTPHAAFDPPRREPWRALLHQSPRTFGKPTSQWTLALAAEMASATGLTHRPISGESIRRALAHLGIRWQRATHWITSPDPAYRRKKKRRDRLIALAVTHPTWGLGFGDEVWWSRLAHPALHAWAPDAHAVRLVEKARPKTDSAPQALACYGLLVRHVPTQPAQMLLRFVERRPVSRETTAFLAWCRPRLAAQGLTAVLLIWDNASWHISHEVRTWLRHHNRTVKQTGQGVRLVACRLPSKSPWLNPIEPKWVHGKRAIGEPDRLRSAQEVMERVYAYYGCVAETHLAISKKAA